MAKSLRDRQKQIAREAILQALAEEVSEIGSFDFSINDIAERAGVSHRTVYNYFASRQGLIDAFTDWTGSKIRDEGGVLVPGSLDDLAGALVVNFQIFEKLSGVAEVLAQMGTAERISSTHTRRTEAFVGAVAVAYPELDERQQIAVAALLRQVASVRTWYSMTRELGLSTDEAAVVGAWAVSQLQSSLDRGAYPETGVESG